ncbi:MAG: hypothetical protein J0H67_20330 [Rhodospirillales bacterium]|nr:hypothetical protein [Rhodospirillales bacterium]MBN8902080.1 hypothetical protein [Rhodospirillales bacterium]
MKLSRIRDRLHWGWNITARKLGEPAIAYRPHDAGDPLAPANRYLRLPAVFTPVGADSGKAPGSLLYTGTYDASYTRPGDYLVQGDRTWFIASQDALLPSLCVEANRVVSFARPAQPASTGANPYSGVTTAGSTPLTGPWPAGMRGHSNAGRSEAGLPTDLALAYWTVLLPPIPSVALQVSDLMSDDLGRSGVVAAAEFSRLGWNLTVRESST